MVVGCRTIKCYGWENHYLEKINRVRNEQMKLVIKFNIVQSFGTSFFQNMGLVAVFIILLSEWAQEKVLETDRIISMLAMIYFVFFSINVTFYFGLTNVQNFLAILQRLSTVFNMEEYKSIRDTNVERKDVMIKI